MRQETFAKILTANDVGSTGAHQAGMLIPKKETQLLSFFPFLDPKIKNPDAWLTFVDPFEEQWSFRYIYYNNKLHDVGGTRNEYRITHMTRFFKQNAAIEGEELMISKGERIGWYSIRINRDGLGSNSYKAPGKIKLKGWRKVH